MFSFIDLFAGLGGFRLGLESVGFKCVFGSDFDAHAARMYKANFGEDIHSDVSLLDPAVLPDFDVLCGGFPCQPFSAAGLKKGFEDTRGTLFFDVCRILEAKKPQVVFLENVKHLVAHDKGNTFQVIVSTLEGLGYTVSSRVLNAVEFGVPQSRERILIVGHLGGKTFDFDQVQTVTPRVQLRSVLELPSWDMEWVDPALYEIIPEEFQKVQAGSGLKFVGFMKANLRKGVESSVFTSRVHRQQNRIYSDLGTHPTLSSQEPSGRYYIQTPRPDGVLGVRKLTMVEVFRLFGYPDDFVRVGSIAEQYKRVGNSIAVPMVGAVASEIRKQLLV